MSIIIPMVNEEKYIGKCLDTIFANDFPEDAYEVIVVDGESTDRSREIVQDRAKAHPSITLLSNPRRVVPPGLNLALRAARGKYIVRMDAHSEYPRDYIRCCVEELDRTGAANVGGRWITRPGAATPIAEAIANMTQVPAGIGNSAFRLGKTDRYVDTVPFGAFRREVFERVGLFREDMVRHQDFELNARIRASGGGVYLSPRIANVYYNAPTLRRFMRQAYLNGVWIARGWVRYPVSFSWRHAAPVLFVLALLVPLLLGIAVPAAMWVSAAVLAIYAIAAILTGIQVALRTNWRQLFLVPVVMFSYHFVYGITTLIGLATPYSGTPRVPLSFLEPVPGNVDVAREPTGR